MESCIECGCEIPEGEDQYTSTTYEGPYCDDCIDDAEAESQSLRFA